MHDEVNPEARVLEILWEALEGGEYDRQGIEKEIAGGTKFEDFLDSLDITDFVLRLEHYFGIKIAQEDYPRLSTVSAVNEYIQKNSPTPTHA